MNHSHDDLNDTSNEVERDKLRAAVSLSVSETVSRYGSASAEYIKGYTGIDNAIGKTLSKGLKGISQEGTGVGHKAGWAAEVVTTARDNAEAIIAKAKVRTIRSDDLKHYGIKTDAKYREVVDRVRVSKDGEIIYEAQTKFEKAGNKVANQVSHDDHKYRKYFGKKLELPSDQAESAKKYCIDRGENLRRRALKLDALGEDELAKSFRNRADRFDKLASEDIIDVGITKHEAESYARNPLTETTKDIFRTSHRAGKEGAKYGAIIGCTISLLSNAFAIAQEKKQWDEAGKDVVLDTTKATALGYGATFIGAAIKGGMQQSGNTTLRALSATNAPALALNVCLSLTTSINRYVGGDIDEVHLLEEIGEKGAGMLSGSMMAALGQLAIPVPVVGAAIGGMIGYTLSSMFYHSALEAGQQNKAAQFNLERVRGIEAEARHRIAGERAALAEFTEKEFREVYYETKQLFSVLDPSNTSNSDDFTATINRYAELLGVQLQFKSQIDFDLFMKTDEALRL